MQPALLIRLRPLGPWRYGPGDGGHNRTDLLFRSDRLFSALTLAASQLGFLHPWLDATVRASEPALALSSLFPFGGETLFAPPPRTLWPPPAAIVTSPSPLFLSKVRWDAAAFVPVPLIESILLSQKVLADQWAPDPESRCLLRRDRPSSSPFRAAVRTGSTVDRLSGSVSVAHTMACVEFEPGAGLWTAVRFSDEAASETWSERLEALFRLLCDTGFGGRRSAGWGQSQAPVIQKGLWPHLLLPKLGRVLDRNASDNSSDAHWLLSLFTPAPADQVDWTRGDYSLLERSGWTAANGTMPAPKKRVRMVAEGSVLSASQPLRGTSVDVAPAGYGHPVYRSGLALALNLPLWQEPPAEDKTDGPVEMPTDPDALEPAPCAELPAEPEFESQNEPEPVAEPEFESQNEPEPVTEPEFESQNEPEPVAEPEFESQNEPDEREPVAGPQFESQNELERVAEPEFESQNEPERSSEPGFDGQNTPEPAAPEFESQKPPEEPGDEL